MTTPRILLVDDEAPVLAALKRALRRHFGETLTVETFTDALEALEFCRWVEVDVALSDLRMPEIDGVGFLTLLSAIQPQAVRMVLTGSADFDTAQRAINDAGVFRYLCKPWSDEQLVGHVRAALHERERGLLETLA
jgi:two-component system probable response regulator PhcQ